MSQPRDNKKPGRTNTVQAKTMFYTEGNPFAALVKNLGGRHDSTMMNFKTAEGALAWCRQNGAMLVYMPVNLAHG